MSDTQLDKTAPPNVADRDSHGWHVVLGENFAGNLLCVDFMPGEHSGFFEKIGATVSAIDLSKSDDDLRQARLGLRLSESLEDCLARGLSASFDGFILHDLMGRLLVTDSGEATSQLLRLVFRLLKPDGFCYLGFVNANALLRREKTTKSGDDITLRPGTIRAAYARAGFNTNLMRFHPYLIENGAVLEVLPERGYTSVKNSRLFRERIKEWCYGRFGARYWAPGYGAIAYKEHAKPSLVDLLAQRLDRLPMFVGKQMRMMRCQLLLEKVIFSFGTGTGKSGQFVVVYTRNARSIARRQAEVDTLKRLIQRIPALHSQLPRFLARGSLGSSEYFVLSEFAGMTIDRPCPGTDAARKNAAIWLTRFHKSTAIFCGSSPECFDELVAGLFRDAIERYPPLRNDICVIARAVQRRAARHDWLSVWQHGDFKLENVIINQSTSAIVAVIDWELSKERGLPLLDMLYLIVYDRSVRQRRALEEIYLTEVLPWSFARPDMKLLTDYAAVLALTLEDTTMWAAIYLIHDIGIRRHYSLAIPHHCTILKTMLTKTADALELSSELDGKLSQTTRMAGTGR